MALVLVTGASSGIGRSLARRFAADGDAVAVLARRLDLLESLVEEIEAAGGTALSLPCDVTDRDRVFDAVARIRSALGPIDILVANAGGALLANDGGKVEPSQSDIFDAGHVARVIDLNLFGTVNCIEAVLPEMLARGSGQIVAVGSLAASRGVPGAGSYCAAKAALAKLIEALRVDLEPHGIAVTLLLPGFVRAAPNVRKPRLFTLELEEGTRRIYRAIRRRRRSYAFALPVVLLALVGRCLPDALYDPLIRRLRRRRRAPAPAPAEGNRRSAVGRKTAAG